MTYLNRSAAAKIIHTFYINSPIWIKKKEKILDEYQKNNWPIRCLKCCATHNLQLHHNFYIKDIFFGFENISDLDYLCADCHNIWHKIQKESGISQNDSFEKYYEFLLSNNKVYSADRIRAFFEERIAIDKAKIENYFSRSDVIENEKELKKSNRYFTLALIPSLVLILLYGIGIVLAALLIFLWPNKNKIEDYDLFFEKRICLKEKIKFFLEPIS